MGSDVTPRRSLKGVCSRSPLGVTTERRPEIPDQFELIPMQVEITSAKAYKVTQPGSVETLIGSFTVTDPLFPWDGVNAMMNYFFITGNSPGRAATLYAIDAAGFIETSIDDTLVSHPGWTASAFTVGDLTLMPYPGAIADVPPPTMGVYYRMDGDFTVDPVPKGCYLREVGVPAELPAFLWQTMLFEFGGISWPALNPGDFHRLKVQQDWIVDV